MTKGHFCGHHYEMHNQNSAKKNFFCVSFQLVHGEFNGFHVILEGTGRGECTANLSLVGMYAEEHFLSSSKEESLACEQMLRGDIC